MMHKEIEVYVDDMIAKSQTEDEHLVNLRKLFGRLRKYQLKLNPTKCTFGVKSGKLLGFIVSQKGIKIDPEKVKAILEMPERRTEKQVRGPVEQRLPRGLREDQTEPREPPGAHAAYNRKTSFPVHDCVRRVYGVRVGSAR